MFETQQGRGIKINKLLIQDTGTYNPQYRRPYDTHLVGNDLQVFQERVGSADAIAPAQMAGFANTFIGPTAEPEKIIDIPQGWGERRCRFMMEVEYNYTAGGAIIEVILGFTDYVGIAHSGAIDPNMQFYVNSVTHLRTTNYNSPAGMQAITNVIDTSQILVNPVWRDIYTPTTEQSMRPTDVYTVISRTHLPDTGTILDLRNSLTNIPIKSRRSNNDPAAYTAKILQNYKVASATHDTGEGEQEILAQARGLVSEDAVNRDPFLKAVGEISHHGIGNYFTYQDLLNLDPTVIQRTKPVLLGVTQATQVHQAGQTQHWGGTDRDTLIATSLSNSVPAIMAEVGLMKVEFFSSNRQIGGTMLTTLADANSFANMDLSAQCQTFINILERQVLWNLSFENHVDFAVRMSVDLVGETHLTLSFDGGPPIDYVTPSFCDALLSPVVTSNKERTMQLARDFESLTSTVMDTRSSAFLNTPSGGAFGGSFGSQGGLPKF